jgi:hypothetical protein
METKRLATYIGVGVDERLRLLALLRRQRLSRLLTDLLDTALPTAEELTGQLARRREVAADDRA